MNVLENLNIKKLEDFKEKYPKELIDTSKFINHWN